MSKRLLSAALWSFAALYGGSVLHGVAGTSELLGPAVGLSTAALIVANPVARLSVARRATRIVAERPSPGLAGEPA